MARVYPLGPLDGPLNTDRVRPLSLQEQVYALERIVKSLEERNLLLYHQLEEACGDYSMYQAWLKTLPRLPVN